MKLERFGIQTIRFIDWITDVVIGIALCVMLLFGAYSIWDSHQLDHVADPVQYAAYRPAEDTAGFDELRAMNPEVFAWLMVIDTPIDYPVTQADNNEKYINTDAKGNYTLSGSLFLDYRNRPEFDDFKSVIYGHHMANERMFGALSNFAERDYFDAHPYGDLFYQGRSHGLQFFALVLTDAYDDLLFDPAEPDQRQAVLDAIRERAVFLREGVSVTTSDQIVVLSTCTEDITNGRYMLIGKLTDEVYLTEDTPRVNRGTGLTDPNRGWLGLPMWVWIAAGAVLLLLVWITIRIVSSRKGSKTRGRTK